MPNPYRIKAREALINSGIEIPEGVKIADCDAAMEAIKQMIDEGGCLACCSEGCSDIEPDGRCEHGCQSVLIALGLC